MSKRERPLCIYHYPCLDGFAAALAMRMAYGAGNVDFHKGIYDSPPPDVTGRTVFILDFSYNKETLEEMAKKAKRITIIDHHISAQKELAYITETEHSIYLNIEAVFDMNHSGAVLSWDYFHPTKTIPSLFLHVQDRDLWKFELSGTKEFIARLASYDYDFARWEVILRDTRWIEEYNAFCREGKLLLEKQEKDMKEHISNSAHKIQIEGHIVPAVNCPYFWASDAGAILANLHPFAATYFIEDGVAKISLRSDKNGEDVSVIAGLFGGGGHKHAAGFRCSLEQLFSALTIED